MSEMVELVALAIKKALSRPVHPMSWHCLAILDDDDAKWVAREAIAAMRNFRTEDFTLAEAAGIRQLIDDALDDTPALGQGSG